MSKNENIGERRGYEFIGSFERPYTVEDWLISDYDNLVHHGYALVLFDQERRRLLREEKEVDVESLAKERKLAGIVTRAEMDLGVALTAGQEVTLNTDVYHRGDRLFGFHHRLITAEGQPAIDANAFIAIVDIADSRKPRLSRMPEDVMTKILG